MWEKLWNKILWGCCRKNRDLDKRVPAVHALQSNFLLHKSLPHNVLTSTLLLVSCPAFNSDPVVCFLAARPMIATLPLRPTVNNGTVLPKKGSGTLPSPSGPGSRKDTSTPASKRWGKQVSCVLCVFQDILLVPRCFSVLRVGATSDHSSRKWSYVWPFIITSGQHLTRLINREVLLSSLLLCCVCVYTCMWSAGYQSVSGTISFSHHWRTSP